MTRPHASYCKLDAVPVKGRSTTLLPRGGYRPCCWRALCAPASERRSMVRDERAGSSVPMPEKRKNVPRLAHLHQTRTIIIASPPP